VLLLLIHEVFVDIFERRIEAGAIHEWNMVSVQVALGSTPGLVIVKKQKGLTLLKNAVASFKETELIQYQNISVSTKCRCFVFQLLDRQKVNEAFYYIQLVRVIVDVGCVLR